MSARRGGAVDILLVTGPGRVTERAVVERVLAEFDAGIEVVGSYKQALEALARDRYRIAVVWTFESDGDIKPTEAIAIMKQIVPELLVIAISEEKPLETERELRCAGLYYYMTAPITEAELRDVLAGAIRKRSQRHAREN